MLYQCQISFRFKANMSQLHHNYTCTTFRFRAILFKEVTSSGVEQLAGHRFSDALVVFPKPI